MARRIRTRGVKSNRNYTTEEAADVTGVTPQTVRLWIKQGLPALTGQRPYLILGSDLKDFLYGKESDRKRPLKPGELYCLSCKAPTTPALGMVDYFANSPTSGRLTALCAVCETACSRVVRAADLKHWGVCEANDQQWPSSSLKEPAEPH